MEALYKPTKSIREYFDSFAHEFSYSCKEDKLAEIANCVYHGYDFFDELNEQCKEHPDRTETICGTISNYIGMIRGGEFNLIDNFVFDDKINLKQLVELFQDEIRNLYRFPLAQNPYFADVKNYYDELVKRHYVGADEIKKLWCSPTPLDRIPISEEEVLSMNPWKSRLEYVEPLPGGSTLYDDNAQCVLKCDKAYISEHNRNNDAEYKYRIQKWPKPFMGNPLTSRVVLLSLNPGFKDWQKRLLAKALGIYYREAIYKHLHEQTDLDADSMFCPNLKPGELDITCLEAHTLVDNYWYDMIEKFRKAAEIPKSDEAFDPLYSRLSVIEYVGYASTSYKDLAKGRIMPSQYFSRMLIQHLTMNCKTVFVVVRAEEHWKKLLGERIWNKLEREDRLIVGRKIRRQSLTAIGLGEDGFCKLVNLLK
ncbi:MAG: hypothetical protein IK004_04730 [Bacteroidales bacterium]|nr:hypothetical protein [Bacteroidales bacterium]